jgi:hypothetical protein
MENADCSQTNENEGGHSFNKQEIVGLGNTKNSLLSTNLQETMSTPYWWLLTKLKDTPLTQAFFMTGGLGTVPYLPNIQVL